MSSRQRFHSALSTSSMSSMGVGVCLPAFLAFMVFACDDTSSPQVELSGEMQTEIRAGEAFAMPSGTSDLPAGEVAGAQMSGDSIGAGMSAGDSAGDETGAQSGEIAGSPAGNPAGSTAGDIAGSMAGEPAGGAAGDAAGMIAGAPAGELEAALSCNTVDTEWRPAPQQGTIYLAHFLSSEIIRYRIDGEFPVEDTRFDVGADTHDAALDGVHNLYAVALNIPQTVKIYTLPRVSDHPEGDLPQPLLEATIQTTPYTPRRVFFDSARQRLLIQANAPLNGQPLEEMFMFMYDVSQPSAPVALTPEPTSLPVSTTLAVEPRAGTLALVDLTSHHLMLYDITGDAPILHPGDPINVRAQFPEEGGQDAFQLRNMRFDPIRGRLMMARAQSIVSEVITYAYPPIEPKPADDNPTQNEDECLTSFTYQDLTRVDDPFDVSVPATDRANLLGAFIALPMIGEPRVLFVNYAWRAPSIAAMVTLMREGDDQRLYHEEGCGDYEGFGCFYSSYYEGRMSSYNHLTDGAACVDQTHGVFAGAGLEDDENSQLFLFRIDRDRGGLSPILSESDRNLGTAPYPLHLGCH